MATHSTYIHTYTQTKTNDKQLEKISSVTTISYKGWDKLIELHLDNNSLTEIDPLLFQNAYNVETLSLHDNQLTELPSEIMDLSKLKSLRFFCFFEK